VVADAAYSRVDVTVTNSAGGIVAENSFKSVPQGEMDFTWDGFDKSEPPVRLLNGLYGISAMGVSANGTRVPLKVNPLLRVDAAINDAGDWKIKLGDGKTYGQSDLKGIY
jgi:flagellar hook assembly protein FlgD